MARKRDVLPYGIRLVEEHGSEVLVRQCPSCNNDILYKGKSRRWNVKVAIRNGTVCNICDSSRRKSKRPWNVGIPMSDAAKQKRSLVLKGKCFHTDEFKQWLSTYGAFTRTGAESNVVHNMLQRRNITYEEYIQSLSEFQRYKRECLRITNQQPIFLLENIHKRGKSGINGAYHLDHIISIKQGFDDNIDPTIIGDISNLQMIPWEENIQKAIIYTNTQKKKEII